MAKAIIQFVTLPDFPPAILESHLINCIDIGGTCNCTCSSCLDSMGQCRCIKCRCNRSIAIIETLITELYEEEPSDYMIG